MQIQSLNALNFYCKKIVFKGKRENKTENFSRSYDFNHEKMANGIENYAIAKILQDVKFLNKKKILQTRIEEEQKNLPEKLEEIKKSAKIYCNLADVYYLKSKENYESAVRLYPEIKEGIKVCETLDELSEAQKIDVREEYDENNQLKRRIIFEGGTPSQIIVINPDGTQDCFDYLALPSLIKAEIERKNAFSSSNLDVKISKNIQQNEKDKSEFVFEFENGYLWEISKDVVKNDDEIIRNETYLFDYDLDDERELVCFAQGLKRGYSEYVLGEDFEDDFAQDYLDDFVTEDDICNSIERLYRLQGLCALLINVKCDRNNIEFANNAKEKFYFNENNEIICALKYFPDGDYERWGKF